MTKWELTTFISSKAGVDGGNILERKLFDGRVGAAIELKERYRSFLGMLTTGPGRTFDEIRSIYEGSTPSFVISNDAMYIGGYVLKTDVETEDSGEHKN